MNNYIEWPVDNAYYNSEDYKLNNKIALKVSDKGFEEISKKYTHIKPHEIEFILNLSKNIFTKLAGNGIDLGGGVGSVSAVVALSELVDNIICLEITRNCVIKCHPIVISKILANRTNKVTSVIGDFDNLNLQGKSLDFAIAWDAMHHSNDIVKTLKEVNRVLKKDGYFLVIDRAHNIATPQEELDRMLNVKYPVEFLLDNYLPENKILTRRDNGEHEYRYNEWSKFFSLANFTIEETLIVKGKGKKTIVNNDANIKEVFVNFELGGFENQKVMYLLRKNN